MTKVGEHITLDIIGTDKEYDPSVFERVINEIAKAAKVTILNISKDHLEWHGSMKEYINLDCISPLLYTSEYGSS